jgi:outer membrane protein assembly factor BamD
MTHRTPWPSTFPARSGRILAALVLALPLALAACASGDDEPEYVERPVGELYNNAMDSLLAEDYAEAANLFDEVERQHPYSTWASKAQLMAAYAHYQADKYTEAVNALDRFIELHPGNRDIAYAYYLRGLSFYEQISDVRRDQSMTLRARDALQEVTKRFPDSTYARDAELKLDLTEDHLAGKEMTVGRYYLRKGHYLAAINRFKKVIEEYQTTTHVPEALHRLVESYMRLGVVDEARATAAVLGHNYPGSKWYADSYELLTGEDVWPERDEDSWIARVWDSVT